MDTTGGSPATARRTALAAVLAVVVAVVGIAVVLARPHHTKPANDTLRTLNAIRSQPPAPTVSVSASTATVRTAVPRTAAAVSSSPSPASSGGGGTSSGGGNQTMSNLGPVPSGSLVFGYSSGRDSWSGTSNGVAMSVTMSPSRPRAGQTVTFSIHTSAPKKCCKVYMVYGNGRSTGEDSCMTFPSGTSYTVDDTTIYNRSGRYEFLVGAFSPTCNNQGDLYAWVDVGAGTTTAQGPDLPVVKVDSSTPAPGHENDPSYVTLWGQGDDDDGYITKLVVNWGDGTSSTFAGDPNPCQRTSDGWPAASEAQVPYDPPPAHHYKTYGDFHITLYAYSAACNGSDVQRGQATFTWPDPSPAPSPSPSPSPSST